MELTKTIDKILNDFCRKNKCIEELDEAEKDSMLHTYLGPLPICLDTLVTYFDHLKKGSKETFHICCVVKLLRNVYKGIMRRKVLTENDNKDLFVDTIIKLCKSCLELPDVIFPVPVEIECESVKKYEDILKNNILLTCACFRIYSDVLFTEFTNEDVTGSKKVEIAPHFSDIVKDISSHQKKILKRTAAKAFTSACSRLGDQPWTNEELKEVCNSIVNYIRRCSGYESYSSLLSNSDESSNPVLFQNGLLGIILNEVLPTFQRNTWKKNVPNIHAILWCLKKVTYPNVGPHVSKLVPLLLLLTDDYVSEHKLLGILSLSHLMKNVLPTDLKLYNHADVIYDALMKQLYSNQGDVYEVTLECLLILLPILQSKPALINYDGFTCWDKTLVKVMNNVDLASKINVELVLLKFIPKFIEQMGGNVIKHVDKILDVVSLPIQGDGSNVTKKRLFTLKILYTTIQTCWPIVYMYQKRLFKLIFRMLIDLTMASTVGRNSNIKLVEGEICNVLVLLKMCCPSDADEAFMMIQKLHLDSSFDSVHEVIRKVEETKEF